MTSVNPFSSGTRDAMTLGALEEAYLKVAEIHNYLPDLSLLADLANARLLPIEGRVDRASFATPKDVLASPLVSAGAGTKWAGGGVEWTEAPLGVAEADAWTAAGVPLNAVIQKGRVSMEAFGVEFSDAVTDQTTAVQKAVNFAQKHGVLVECLFGRVKVDRIWFTYDAVENPDMDISGTIPKGQWGLVGVSSPSSSNLESGIEVRGTVFYSATATDTPFIGQPYTGLGNVFVGRGFFLQDVTFEGSTNSGVPVLFLKGFQSFNTVRCSVKQLSDDGNGARFWDCDQWRLDFQIFGNDRATANANLGLEFDFPNIDASRCSAQFFLRGWDQAARLTTTAADDEDDRLRLVNFPNFSFSECNKGLELNDVELLHFTAGQMRATKWALKITGKTRLVSFHECSFEAFDALDANGEANVIIGSSGFETFDGIIFKRCRWDIHNDVVVYGVLWRAGAGREGITIEEPYFFFQKGTGVGGGAVKFSIAPVGGGRIIRPAFSVSNPGASSLYSTAAQSVGLDSIDFGYALGSVVGRLNGRRDGQLFGNGGSKARAGNVTLALARTHTVTGTGTTDNLYIVGSGITPRDGDEIVVYAQDGFTLSAVGNVATSTVLAAGGMVRLVWAGGKWRKSV